MLGALAGPSSAGPPITGAVRRRAERSGQKPTRNRQRIEGAGWARRESLEAFGDRGLRHTERGAPMNRLGPRADPRAGPWPAVRAPFRSAAGAEIAPTEDHRDSTAQEPVGVRRVETVPSGYAPIIRKPAPPAEDHGAHGREREESGGSPRRPFRVPPAPDPARTLAPDRPGKIGPGRSTGDFREHADREGSRYRRRGTYRTIRWGSRPSTAAHGRSRS